MFKFSRKKFSNFRSKGLTGDDYIDISWPLSLSSDLNLLKKDVKSLENKISFLTKKIEQINPITPDELCDLLINN